DATRMTAAAFALLVGFSCGMALLLALALATVYRSVDLPWQSRIGGYVMLAGLALTQLGHLQMLQQPGHGVTRSYAVVLLLQSVGFYWLLLGVLRQASDWRSAEWALPPAVLLLAVLVPTGWAVPAGLALGSL